MANLHSIILVNKDLPEQDWGEEAEKAESRKLVSPLAVARRLLPTMNSFKSFVKTMADKAPEGLKAGFIFGRPSRDPYCNMSRDLTDIHGVRAKFVSGQKLV